MINAVVQRVSAQRNAFPINKNIYNIDYHQLSELKMLRI